MSDPTKETETDRRCSESSDSEYDPQYKPIISLPEVVVLTNEENEVELLKVRAKLYRWDAHGDPAEWKERGTGELKILRHTGNNNVRVVMRRDKTLKVCANHFIVPWLELSPKSGTDKAFVYSVIADFADEQAKSETFAVKFGNVENANLFKSKFEEAKEIVKTKCSLYNGEDDKEQSGDESEETSDEEDEKKDDTIEVQKKLSELEVTKKEEKSEE
ncbi:ran-specific GTPase-activating protein-like [Coccinella septempunctata]|uniref:ran-specific GTPase-activating protein-like n=1 Tax=Coccinella septempunctata TaxID=41139 RepID=UPI001D082239|nr:ran-specific GTPase-activating protein-like [Coccinella septempunctata]